MENRSRLLCDLLLLVALSSSTSRSPCWIQFAPWRTSRGTLFLFPSRAPWVGDTNCTSALPGTSPAALLSSIYAVWSRESPGALKARSHMPIAKEKRCSFVWVSPVSSRMKYFGVFMGILRIRLQNRCCTTSCSSVWLIPQILAA